MSASKRVMELHNIRVGDQVRVRLDSASPYRGRTGMIEQQLPNDTRGFWYMVRFESRDLSTTVRFVERDLEKVSGWWPVKK